jgi:hypothetical protein
MSNNWDITQVTTAQSDKEGAINALVAKVIEGVGESISVNFGSDANTTPTAADVLTAYRLNATSSGSLTATRSLILPLKKKTWVVKNSTTGGQSITIIGSSGTGVTIPNGSVAEVICDGTNFALLRQGDPLLAYKTAAQTAIGTSYADVTELGFAVEANKSYAFEWHLISDANGVGTGIDVACNGPASPTLIQYDQIYWTSTTARAERGAIAYDTDTASAGSNGTAARIFIVRGVLINGANAGTLIPRAKAEAASGGTCNVRAGSWGKLTKLN